MRLSCTSTMVPGKDLTEKARNLSRWGYEGIAVFVDYEDWNQELYQELLSLQEHTGVVPCEFAFGDGIYGHLMDRNPDIRKRSREMYKLAARISGEIGAVTELEFEYGPQSPLPLFHPYAKMRKEEEQEFCEMYRELAEPLKGTEGKMLLEGINRYESPYLNSIRDCRDIVGSLGLKEAGVLADFFHMSIEESDYRESILYAGEYIKHVHLGDSNRLLPGHGMTDWKACFDALKEIGYKGFVNLECSTCGNPEVTLPETADYLRKLIG